MPAAIITRLIIVIIPLLPGRVEKLESPGYFEFLFSKKLLY
jgi:hypothetical protein